MSLMDESERLQAENDVGAIRYVVLAHPETGGNGVRRPDEDEATVRGIAMSTGIPEQRVSVVVTALRDAIDGLLRDGYSVVAWPLDLAFPNDPVAAVFWERLADATDEEVKAWRLGDSRSTATWLGLSENDYLQHPIASDLGVLVELLDILGVDDIESAQAGEAEAVANAWYDSFTEPRLYRLSDVGLERDLEQWLIDHPEALAGVGYAVRLKHQQLILPDRRRPDLIFDLLDNEGVAGTLVVELKATSGYLEAVDQLAGYLNALRPGQAADAVLEGLLIADGFDDNVLAYARATGIDVVTLRELGYRHDLSRQDLIAGTHVQDATAAKTAPQTRQMETTVTEPNESEQRESKQYTVFFGWNPTIAPLPDVAVPAVWFSGQWNQPPDGFRPADDTDIANLLTAWVRREINLGRTVGQLVEEFRSDYTWVHEGRWKPRVTSDEGPDEARPDTPGIQDAIARGRANLRRAGRRVAGRE